jgi:uncharacterized protein YozE (UPF0346 family)
MGMARNGKISEMAMKNEAPYLIGRCSIFLALRWTGTEQIRYSMDKLTLTIGRRSHMYKSFYHFLMKYRTTKPKDAISRFANSAYDDLSFPKNSEDYDEISSYLEINAHYPESMAVFDEAWEEYLISES